MYLTHDYIKKTLILDEPYVPDVPSEPVNPCRPNPCGPNAIPDIGNDGNCKCSCPPDLVGDPYTICRPECVLNSDCPRNEACAQNKCKDPCSDTCGINADCTVVNHIPTCTCHKGYMGNAFEECHKKRKHVFTNINQIFIFLTLPV